MLGCADELASCLETSAPLGAHHPCLPAPALLFQHPVERRALVISMAHGFAHRDRNVLCAPHRRCLFAHSDCSRAKSATPVHAGNKTGFTILARAGERFVAVGNLVRRIRWQHRRMARTKNETAPRWHFGKWWAMRDSNPRPSPCKGAALPLRQPPTDVKINKPHRFDKLQILSLNACCLNASNKTNATQFDKFNERDFVLNIGIRSQRSRFCSSNCFGIPAVSRPKTR